MNDFESDINDIMRGVESLKKSCQEALNETWDRSDPGFEAMINLSDELLVRLLQLTVVYKAITH